MATYVERQLAGTAKVNPQHSSFRKALRPEQTSPIQLCHP